MIYTATNQKKLYFSSPLLEYIRKNNCYNEEKLIYSNKYTDGTFSITNPTSEYKNCFMVNGYPHFYVPIDVCLAEIYSFIHGDKIYDYNFKIRYGDTHPHKPVPKLAQTRGLYIEKTLSSLINNDNVDSYYAIGDISSKTIDDFIKKNNIDASNDEIFLRLLNGSLCDSIKQKFKDYNKESLKKIKEFLKDLKLQDKNYLFESSLYDNNDLYCMLKKYGQENNELKENQGLSYALQELMFAYSLLVGKQDVLINIIGFNQSDHVLKVNNILKDSNSNVDCRFLTYNICRNADERDKDIWFYSLQEYIEQNELAINGKLLEPTELLHILYSVLNNDAIIDFSKLCKHTASIRNFCNQYENLKYNFSSPDIVKTNHLIAKMALVNYNVNKAIETGNQRYFYNYMCEIINEYENHKEEYKDIGGLYNEFMNTCFSRMGFVQNQNILIRKRV